MLAVIGRAIPLNDRRYRTIAAVAGLVVAAVKVQFLLEQAGLAEATLVIP